MMKQLANYLTVPGLAIALLACTTQAADNGSESVSHSEKLPIDAKVVKYTPLTQEETVPGSILASKEVQITSEIARKVISIHFQEGAYVNKGQLLYKLDDNDIKARLKQVEAEFALAKLTESRLASLLKSESVRHEEYDIALAKLQTLEATQELLQIELDKTSITAPFAGIAGITRVEAGSLVTPGTPLVTLQAQHKVKIEFTVTEKYLPYLRRGKAISFSVLGQSERQRAKITAIESGLDIHTRAIKVHAETTNDRGSLKPGMSARVYFSIVADGAKGLTLPTQSLISGPQGYHVLVVRNGAAKVTPVAVGNRDEAEVLITGGLADGDTVLISNILRAGEGTPVQVVSIK